MVYQKNGVHLVDPVYVTMGDPASDMTSVGIKSILRSLSHNPSTQNTDLLTLTKQLFLNDKATLVDSLSYCLATTSLPYDKRPDWMDYHQECGLIGLRVWQEKYASDIT